MHDPNQPSSSGPNPERHRGEPAPDAETRRPPRAQHAPDEAERLTGLAHDLNSLLDGSMRWLELATRTLATRDAADADADLHRVREQLETVHETLRRMVEIVDGSMRGTALPLGSPFRADSQRVSLGDTVQHAAEVLRLMGEEHGVRVEVRVADDARALPGGRVYPVLINGIQNAIEAIAACTIKGGGLVSGGKGAGGLVEIDTRLNDAGEVEILITDDGHGPPTGRGADAVFRFGYTTKPKSMGVGLAMSRDLIEEIGGRIELTARSDRAVVVEGRPGAVLRVRYPAPKINYREGAA